MQWIACYNCGHERAYSGPKPVGARIECPAECGANVRVVTSLDW